MSEYGLPASDGEWLRGLMARLEEERKQMPDGNLDWLQSAIANRISIIYARQAVIRMEERNANNRTISFLRARLAAMLPEDEGEPR